jgi:hypothetical protein
MSASRHPDDTRSGAPDTSPNRRVDDEGEGANTVMRSDDRDWALSCRYALRMPVATSA